MLTGCLNKQFGMQELDREISRAKRYRQKLSIMLIDLEEIYKYAPKEHQEALEEAEQLIENCVSAFEDDLEARKNAPNLSALDSASNEHIKKFWKSWANVRKREQFNSSY